MQTPENQGAWPTPLAVWAFIPYWQVGPDLVIESYDTPQTRRELDEVFHALGLAWTCGAGDHRPPRNRGSFILQSANGQQPLILNFATLIPYLEVQGSDVIQHLEELGLAFTGADAPFYHISTSKILMKEALPCGKGYPRRPLQ
ncbi:MAG: hypothetical protein IPL49_13640 [Saprospirales bacterium]|nr:hypothetical protein [Saprospirales bacterium]